MVRRIVSALEHAFCSVHTFMYAHSVRSVLGHPVLIHMEGSPVLAPLLDLICVSFIREDTENHEDDNDTDVIPVCIKHLAERNPPLTFAFTPDRIIGMLSSCSDKADIPSDKSVSHHLGEQSPRRLRSSP